MRKELSFSVECIFSHRVFEKNVLRMSVLVTVGGKDEKLLVPWFVRVKSDWLSPTSSCLSVGGPSSNPQNTAGRIRELYYISNKFTILKTYMHKLYNWIVIKII